MRPTGYIRQQIAAIRPGWHRLQHNWAFQLSNKFILLTTLTTGVILIWKYGSLPPQIPFWFSRPWGDDQLAAPLWLAMLPAGVLLWHAVNCAVGIFVGEHRIFSKALFVTSLLLSVLSTIIVVKVIFMVS